MSWIPGADVEPSGRGAPRTWRGDSRHTVTTFEVGPIEGIRLRATATVRLGTLKQRKNRIILKSRCTLGGQAYVEVGMQLLPSNENHSGRTVSIDEIPFVSKRWHADIVEGDCDIWVSLREHTGEGRFEETLLASRCHRDGVWGEEGCAPLPSLGDSKPVEAGSIDFRVHSFGFRTSRKGRHSLAFRVEYGVKHAVHPDWELEAEAECTAGSETVTYAGRINGVDLFELRPGELTRGFLYGSGSVKKTLSVPAERCEVRVRAEKARGEESFDLATFCLEPGKDARTGACTSA